MSHLGRNIFRRRAVVRGRTGRTAANPLDRLSWEPVPLESVEQLTCASASSLVVVMVGWPDPALARQPPDQGLDVPPGRRPAGAGARGPGRPAAAAPGAALWVSRRARPRAGHGLQGKLRRADIQAYTQETDVVSAYAHMARVNPTFAKFNRIRIDEDGEPDRHDLELAWLGGARAIRLTPR